MATDLEKWTSPRGHTVRIGELYHDAHRVRPRTMRVTRLRKYTDTRCDAHLEVLNATGARWRATRIDATRLTEHPYVRVCEDATLEQVGLPRDRMEWAAAVRDRDDLDRLVKLIGLTLATYAGTDLRVQPDTYVLAVACATTEQVAWRAVAVLRGRGLLRLVDVDTYQLTIPPADTETGERLAVDEARELVDA